MACPRICRCVYHIENVGQTISDPGQKLIVYSLPSIWQYPFFQNDMKIPVFCQNRGIKKIVFVFIVLPIGIAYWPLLFRCGITAPCYSGVEMRLLGEVLRYGDVEVESSSSYGCYTGH